MGFLGTPSTSEGLVSQQYHSPPKEGTTPFVIITGFVCSTMSGRPTTLKRSGSDYSASWHNRTELLELSFQGETNAFPEQKGRYTLLETNSWHLKIDGWKTTFILERAYFFGLISVLGRV